MLTLDTCKNCTAPGGHPIWYDTADYLWRHADSESVGCGSWAPDGDNGTVAEPSLSYHAFYQDGAWTVQEYEPDDFYDPPIQWALIACCPLGEVQARTLAADLNALDTAGRR